MKLEDLTEEQREKISEFGVNTWFVLDLFRDYKNDPSSVSDEWKDYFKDFDSSELSFDLGNGNGNGHTKTISRPQSQQQSDNGAKVSAKPVNMPKPLEGEEPVLIKGA